MKFEILVIDWATIELLYFQKVNPHACACHCSEKNSNPMQTVMHGENSYLRFQIQCKYYQKGNQWLHK